MVGGEAPAVPGASQPLDELGGDPASLVDSAERDGPYSGGSRRRRPLLPAGSQFATASSLVVPSQLPPPPGLAIKVEDSKSQCGERESKEPPEFKDLKNVVTDVFKDVPSAAAEHMPPCVATEEVPMAAEGMSSVATKVRFFSTTKDMSLVAAESLFSIAAQSDGGTMLQ